jgi:hypothetical protein
MAKCKHERKDGQWGTLQKIYRNMSSGASKYLCRSRVNKGLIAVITKSLPDER